MLRSNSLLAFLIPLLSLLSLLAPRAAGATQLVAAADPDPVDLRFELNLGLLAGAVDIGDVSGPGTGLVVAPGVRVGDLAILAEIDYLGVGDGPGVADRRRGRQLRLGVMARHSLVAVGRRSSPLTGEFWVEGGGGREFIAWREGGRLDRFDLAFGFGMQMNGRVGRRTASPRLFGPYFGFRVHVARAPVDRSMPPTCGGPCDRATRPSRADVSLFFHTGVNFGR